MELSKDKNWFEDYWVEVTYVCYPSGSGSTRMWLHFVPQWLIENKGAMITKIEALK